MKVVWNPCSWGFWLRAYAIAEQSLWLDEAVSVIHAQAILNHGTPTLESLSVQLASLHPSSLPAPGA